MRESLERKRHTALQRSDYRHAWLAIVVVNCPPDEIKREYYAPLGQRLLGPTANYAPFGRVFLVSTVGDYDALVEFVTAALHALGVFNFSPGNVS